MNATDTDWIKPDAPVVIYREQHGKPESLLCETTIKRVAAKSFTINGRWYYRFDMETQRTKQESFGWHYYRYVAVRPEAEVVQELRDAQRREQLKIRANDAVEAWQKDRSRGNRLAAIEALQAVED